MQSPLEAVARSLCAKQGHDPDMPTSEGPSLWVFWLDDARAAIRALADNISEEMVEAGQHNCLKAELVRTVIRAALLALTEDKADA